MFIRRTATPGRYRDTRIIVTLLGFIWFSLLPSVRTAAVAYTNHLEKHVSRVTGRGRNANHVTELSRWRKNKKKGSRDYFSN